MVEVEVVVDFWQLTFIKTHVNLRDKNAIMVSVVNLVSLADDVEFLTETLTVTNSPTSIIDVYSETLYANYMHVHMLNRKCFD